MSSDPRTRRETDGAPDEADPPELDTDVEALRARADVEGLVALARAYRSGSAPGGRDMGKCFEAYRAAADLGSADAEYAVALFLLNGGPSLAQDLKEGATRLRAAAEKGSVPAKVCLGNLYELGVHYRADGEKADVWYRNAARSAGVTAAAGTEEHERALAELGCVRHVLALVERSAVDEATKARLLARAKAHGYGLRARDAADDADPGARDRATIVDALATAEPSAAEAPRATAESSAATRERTRKAGAPRRGASEAGDALAAFGYALLFLVAGIGAAYASALGARELVTRGHVLPLVGTRVPAVFAGVLALVGIFPSLLVYRASTVLKALLAGAVMGGVGWVAWGTGHAVLHASPAAQALGFALPGFAAALLVLGLTGGTKPTGLTRRR